MKLSAVICSRNDNYGGHLKERATYCFNSMVDCMDEVWYIDWNTEEGKPSLLYEIYDDIPHVGKINHIVVTPQVKDVLTNNTPNVQKCCEVLSRNLGLRRATGDWLVSTNIDIVAPKREDLLKTMEKLNEKTFYTLSRRGVWVEYDKWEYSKWQDLREYLYDTVPERKHEEKVMEGDDYSIINCCGDFQFAHRDVWHDIRGFEERLIFGLYTDTNVQKKAAMHGFDLKAIFDPPMFHINHGSKGYGGGGIIDGINKVANDPIDAIQQQNKTQNMESWGFSDLEVEYETI